MKYEYIDRELSEMVWQESLEMMTDEQLAELIRRQEEEREADYFEAAWAEMRQEVEESEGVL